MKPSPARSYVWLTALCLLLNMLGCSSASRTVRFATFNSALSRDAPGELIEALQAPDGVALRLFQQNYLARSQGEGLEPIRYEHVYLVPSNTGVPTGVDLSGDGLIALAPGAEVGTAAYADCHG